MASIPSIGIGTAFAPSIGLTNPTRDTPGLPPAPQVDPVNPFATQGLPEAAHATDPTTQGANAATTGDTHDSVPPDPTTPAVQDTAAADTLSAKTLMTHFIENPSPIGARDAQSVQGFYEVLFRDKYCDSHPMDVLTHSSAVDVVAAISHLMPEGWGIVYEPLGTPDREAPRQYGWPEC